MLQIRWVRKAETFTDIEWRGWYPRKLVLVVQFLVVMANFIPPPALRDLVLSPKALQTSTWCLRLPRPTSPFKGFA